MGTSGRVRLFYVHKTRPSRREESAEVELKSGSKLTDEWPYRSEIHVTRYGGIYRTLDGYPRGLGADLVKFLSSRKIVNGIPCEGPLVLVLSSHRLICVFAGALDDPFYWVDTGHSWPEKLKSLLRHKERAEAKDTLPSYEECLKELLKRAESNSYRMNFGINL